MTMDRLRKAARAAGFVMTGIEHDAGEQSNAEQAHAAVRTQALPVPARPLLLAAPAGSSNASGSSLWSWLGAFGRGAPA